MLTAPSPGFLDWKNALASIGLKESHITDDLVVILQAHGFTLSSLVDESFQSYWQGKDEGEAGVKVAKDFSSLNPLQEFLRPAIDWEAAWYNLKTNERYLLIKTNEPNTWALFMPE
jgi:hypothetical protein